MSEMLSAHAYCSQAQIYSCAFNVWDETTESMQYTFSTSEVVTAAYLLQVVFRNNPKSEYYRF